jgi:SAM-dependent methyltransferase
LGAGAGGIGIDQLTSQYNIDLINLDVVANEKLDVVADAHHLPFGDGSCDGIVIQAVLEHVLDPHRVVSEIHRVLRPAGLLYAETPFMQMVHERAYDFTRFTDLGHRYLLKDFAEIERGITGGPGMSLLWAWCYFLRAFCRRRWTANIALGIGRFTGFWLLWIDKLLTNGPGSYDACSGLFFLGRKTNSSITPRELIREFRGL